MDRSVPVICIAGPSAAGKTTVASALVQRLAEQGRLALHLSCDDYYRQDWLPHPRFGYDTTEAIDTPALRAELEALRERRLGDLRHYDMRRRQVSRKPLSQAYDLIVLEGAYGPQALMDDDQIDVLVYLEANLVLRMIRRLRRDVLRRRRSPCSVLQQMVFEMLPGERAFIAPLRSRADLVIRHQRAGFSAIQRIIDAGFNGACVRSDFLA
ncbi:MAG: uridine kinase family protein [Synechococcus sp.]